MEQLQWYGLRRQGAVAEGLGAGNGHMRPRPKRPQWPIWPLGGHRVATWGHGVALAATYHLEDVWHVL